MTVPREYPKDFAYLVTEAIETIRTELTEIAWDDQHAGEALSQFDVVFLDGVFWKKADARVPSMARQPFGMAEDTVSSGGVGDVWLRALVSNTAWSFTSGGLTFLASGGGITQTPPAASGDSVVNLGVATTITAMEFNPGGPTLVGQ